MSTSSWLLRQLWFLYFLTGASTHCIVAYLEAQRMVSGPALPPVSLASPSCSLASDWLSLGGSLSQVLSRAPGTPACCREGQKSRKFVPFALDHGELEYRSPGSLPSGGSLSVSLQGSRAPWKAGWRRIED